MSAFRTLLGASIVMVVGCSGSGATTDGDGGSGGTSSGSTASSSGAGTSSGTASSSGTTGNSSGTTISSSGGDGVGDDASLGGGDDSGMATGDDASPDTDAAKPGGGMTTPPKGTDGGTGQIACNGKACDSATQVCCVTNGREACTDTAMCKSGAFACSGTNSCATGVCCTTPATRMTAESSKCEATCAMGQMQLCTTNADCSGDDICSRVTGACTPPPVVRDGGPRFPVAPFGDAGH